MASSRRGVLEPLGPRLRQSTLVGEADFYAEALSPFRWNGELMCIPQNLSSLVVYYDKGLFDAAGLPYPADDWTWADFLATAKALTLDIDGDGTLDQHGLGTEASVFRVAPFIWQNGGELVDVSTSTGLPFRLAFESPATRAAIQWFVDLQTVHHVVPSAVEEAALSSEGRFQNGLVAMFLDSRRGVPTYRGITGFDWDVAALPRGIQAASILHSTPIACPPRRRTRTRPGPSSSSPTRRKGQTIIAGSGRTVPSLVEVAGSTAFLDPMPGPPTARCS